MMTMTKVTGLTLAVTCQSRKMPPMILRPAKMMSHLLTTLLLVSFTTGRLMAAPSGPTLQLGYGDGKPLDNPLSKFMYFVPLISPDPISVSTNAGNTQCARVISSSRQTNGASFHATCEFEFIGEGLQQNVFDHADCIRKHEKELQ